MGGSGGSGFYVRNPSSLVKNIRTAEQKTQTAEFTASLAELLGGFLNSFNQRDTIQVTERLEALVDCLGEIVDGKIDTIFGGSVARHTYVDGLSDVDCLLLLKSEDVGDKSPSEILTTLASKIGDSLANCEVSIGNLAVTVEYGDGNVIQLLPAIKSQDRFKVASWDGNQWSNINPQKFQKALTKVNQECAGKLVPVIKLVKAVNASFPEDNRLTGYHIESLAINIFKNYNGTKNTMAMTEHFFDKAGAAVKSPVRDTSGQSVHVDEELGNANSDKRMRLSSLLERVNRRIKNANARESIETWKSLFSES